MLANIRCTRDSASRVDKGLNSRVSQTKSNTYFMGKLVSRKPRYHVYQKDKMETKTYYSQDGRN